ncbi:hypothetical protein [Sulfurimonas sp.]|uniref:hypothetical protein n=1 Tax=Sulfurimonas sp. TaxID=2022749 RepID=UPI00356B519D
MSVLVDGMMVVLFIIFMVFVFGGYHKNKSAQREAGFKRDEEKQNKNNKESES